RTVRVWRTDGAGDPVVLPGHEMGLSSVVFGPDKLRLASVAGDHRVRVWNTDGTGDALVLWGVAETVAFNASGARMLAAGRGSAQLSRTDRAAPPLVFDSRPVLPLAAAS